MSGSRSAIAEAVLFRQIARAWGLERTGARIVERLRRLLPSEAHRSREGDVVFLWPAPNGRDRIAVPRVADDREDSRRHTAEVCIEELGVFALLALQRYDAMPRQDTCRVVCRFLGMARMPSESEARVSAAIANFIAANRIRGTEDLLVVPATGR